MVGTDTMHGVRTAWRALVLLLAIGAVALCPQPMAAQEPAPPAAPPPVAVPATRFPGIGAGSTETIQIQGERGFYTENDVAYGVGRTTVTHGKMTISADRMAIDLITQQIEAEGNVVFTTDRDEVRGSAARYDFRRMEGVAYDAEGVTGRIHFRTEWDEDTKGPSFRRISEDEALFRGASYTTSGFPVPTWRLQADEIILIPGERVFMRNAVLYVRDVPVFYFPVYTQALESSTPWSFEIGTLSRYGPYLSVRYTLRHESRIPDYEDPSRMRTRSQGRLGIRSDFFSGGALGVGVDYQYKFDFERHIGRLEIYGVRDTVRDIDDGREETDRFLYRHRHNSLFGQTMLQWNAEWMSDPEVEYDFFDPFLSGEKRGRRPERRVRAAISYLEEDWVARFTAEIKDRVTLARYSDFTDPLDDDLNYDTDPNLAKTGNDSDGLSSSRYGRVTDRYHGRIASRLLPFYGSESFYDVEFNIFRALDSGFHERSERDDEYFHGSDIYGSLTHRMKLDPQGRFTWLNTVGAGVGFYTRDSSTLLARRDRVPFVGNAMPVGGQRFRNRTTVFLGDSDRDADYKDVNPAFVWADYTSRLNARFTDNLSGYLKYTFRKGTSDGVGDFFERVGRQEAFEDIYNFPIEKHWIEAFLSYSPLYPRLETYLTAGYNLQSRGDIFANERLYYIGTGANYETDSREWRLSAMALFDARQARDRRDPNEYTSQELSGMIKAEYVPNHGRYWGSLTIDGSYPLSTDPVSEPNRKKARFTENRDDINITPLIGRKFGPKYDVELMAQYNTRIEDFKEAGVLVRRDLYDADLTLFTGFRSTSSRSRDSRDDTNESDKDTRREMVVRVGLSFKVPDESAGLSAVSLRTMRDRQREASFVE